MPRFDKEYQEYLRGECENYNQPLINALKEKEKGGEDYMIDNNNKCSFCGVGLQTGLTLCVNCWQVGLRKELRHKAVLRRIIDDQDLEIGKLRVLCEKLLDHIVNDRVSSAELAVEMFEDWKGRGGCSMKKVGYTVIKKDRNGGKRISCTNCGRSAYSRVTFGDDYGKVTVSLCKYCAQKNYEDLRLQTRFDWPIA